jgi:DNA-binding ferritin-like protein (Dps family)
MEVLKKQILELLENNTIDERSSTGTTGERIIYAPYEEIVDDIIKMVSDNFELKKCMPDGINSKEEHEEYLKAKCEELEKLNNK